MRVPGRDEGRLVRRRLERCQTALDLLMGARQAVAKTGATWAGPVDLLQARLRHFLQSRTGGVVSVQAFKRVCQNPKIVCQLVRTRVDAHQAKDWIRLPLQRREAGPDRGRELILRTLRQVDQAVELIQPVIGLAVEVEHALNALELASDAKRRFERVGAEALGHQRRVLDGPAGRATEAKPQPDGGIERLAPIATWPQHWRLRIVVVRQTRGQGVLANNANLGRLAALQLEPPLQLETTPRQPFDQ